MVRPDEVVVLYELGIWHLDLLEQERRRKSYCGAKTLLISLGIHTHGGGME